MTQRKLHICVVLPILACAHAPQPRVAEVGLRPQIQAEPRATEPTCGAEPPSLDWKLRPDFSGRRLEVQLRATGSPEQLKKLTLERAPAPDWRPREARDARGPLDIELERQERTLSIIATRDVCGALELRYELPLTTDPRLLIMEMPEGLHASGESLYILPDFSAQEPIPTTLEFALTEENHYGASSFALGRSQGFTANVAELRSSDVLAGGLETAAFDGPVVHDHAALLGLPYYYDFRWVAAETAGVRSAVDEYFGFESEAPFSSIFIADAALASAEDFSLHPRARSMLMAIKPDLDWAGEVRMAIATLLVHRWLGATVRIVDAETRDSLWFTQGFSRAIAQERIYRLGTLSDQELLAEVNGKIITLATSPLRDRSNAELAALASAEALRVVIARGQLYAIRLTALLSERSDLQWILSPLIRRALAEQRSEIPLAEWLESIERGFGAQERANFERMVLAGEPLTLPEESLGRCFVSRRRKVAGYRLGFELPPRSFDDEPQVIASVEHEGPAWAAGIREGDQITSLHHVAGNVEQPVEVTIERDGHSLDIRYLPLGEVARARVWERNPRGDAECWAS